MELSFPIIFTVEQLSSFIESLINERHWSNFETTSIKLEFVPFYFFYCHFFKEEKGTVVEEETKSFAFNASALELDEKTGELHKKNKPKEFEKPEAEYPFEFLEENCSLDEFKKIAVQKLSKNLKVPKQNIEVSGIKKVLVPIWIAFVSLPNKETHKIEVNAVNGKLLQEHKVPFREKGFIELTQETLSELKNPNAWIHYTKSVSSTVFHSSLIHRIGKPFVENRVLQIAIIVIVLAYFVLAYFGLI